MIDPLLAVLVALATVRLTGLWLEDEFTRPVRDRVLTFLGDSRGSFTNWLLILLTCRWCLSVWVGIAVAVIAYYLPTNPVVIVGLVGLSASQIAGMIGDVGR